MPGTPLRNRLGVIDLGKPVLIGGKPLHRNGVPALTGPSGNPCDCCEGEFVACACVPGCSNDAGVILDAGLVTLSGGLSASSAIIHRQGEIEAGCTNCDLVARQGTPVNRWVQSCGGTYDCSPGNMVSWAMSGIVEKNVSGCHWRLYFEVSHGDEVFPVGLRDRYCNTAVIPFGPTPTGTNCAAPFDLSYCFPPLIVVPGTPIGTTSPAGAFDSGWGGSIIGAGFVPCPPNVPTNPIVPSCNGSQAFVPRAGVACPIGTTNVCVDLTWASCVPQLGARQPQRTAKPGTELAKFVKRFGFDL